MQGALPKNIKKNKESWQRKARRLSDLQVKTVLKFVLEYPDYGIGYIINSISKINGKSFISHGGVQSLLTKLNLNTRKKRKLFVKYTKELCEDKIFDLIKLSLLRLKDKESLTPEKRLKAIRLVDDKVPVTKICSLFQISRKNFYKWQERYNQSSPGKEYQAVINRKPIVEHYWRQATSQQVKSVLGLVIKHPEYSTHKIAAKLANIGNHGIQNILKREGLNIYEKRFIYSQENRPVIPAFVKLVQWFRPLIGKIPSLASIPPPASLINAFKKPRTTLPGFLLGLLLSFPFYSWLNMLASAPGLSSKLGLLFASFALLIGSFFFIYSVKYYLTLAIVLSFSRHSLEEGRGFGLSLNGNHGNGGNSTTSEVSEVFRVQGGKTILSWLGKVFGIMVSTNSSTINDNKGIRNLGLAPQLTGQAQNLGGGLQPNLDHITLSRHPFVSLHLPLYNEKKVAERLLKAVTSIRYKDSQGKACFEIIVCDDSNDETISIIDNFVDKYNQKNSKDSHRLQQGLVPKITVLRRGTREGFKGKALALASEKMDKRTEFVSVFDADFVPYPDTLELFVKYFVANGLDINTSDTNTSKVEGFKTNTSKVEGFKHLRGEMSDCKVAVVGGYQWHVLNKSENWITRGVRSEYSGSYVIERPGQEILGLLKQISGSVYMIRADILKKIGWGTSITEDFQLTLKLYEQGYKVVYTPYIQAPAECVSTLKRLIRQRMRWAEGHSHNIKKMFKRLLFGRWEDINTSKVEGFKHLRGEVADINTSKVSQSYTSKVKSSDTLEVSEENKVFIPSPLTLPEKLEFLYLAPYYLQAAFFLVGTFSWLISETVFKARLPFWTALWGWSLVLTNFFALPLVNAIGLFLEEAEERDYLGLVSFIIISYILVPFQAYASIKGFIEPDEGPWFRTPKTGKVTDIFRRGSFYRWVSGILPGRPAGGPSIAYSLRSPKLSYAFANNSEVRYLALSSANNRFQNFQIKRKHWRRLSTTLLVFLIIFSSNLVRLLPSIDTKPVHAQGEIGIGTESTESADTREQPKTSSDGGPERAKRVEWDSSEVVNEQEAKPQPQITVTDNRKTEELSASYQLSANQEATMSASKLLVTEHTLQSHPEDFLVKDSDGNFVPYKLTKYEDRYEVETRSERGIQKIVVQNNSLAIKLYEKTTEDFILKAISTPVFEYQEANSQEPSAIGSELWQQYSLQGQTQLFSQDNEDYTIITSNFSLLAINTSEVSMNSNSNIQVPASIELKIGFDREEVKAINKLSFKLEDNDNINRLRWETTLANSLQPTAYSQASSANTSSEVAPVSIGDSSDGGMSEVPGVEADSLGLRIERNPDLEQVYQMSLLNPPVTSQEFDNLTIDWLDFFKQSNYPPELANSIRVERAIKNASEVSQSYTSEVNVIFYPDGKSGSLTVDPTISTTVAASTITVTSSATPSWKIVFDNSVGGMADEFYTPSSSSTNIVNTTIDARMIYLFNIRMRNNLSSACDTTASLQLIESSSSRVVIMASGDLMSSTSGVCDSPGTDYGNYTQYYTIYPDLINVSGTENQTLGTGAGAAQLSMAFVSGSFDDNIYLSDNDSSPTTVSSSSSAQSVAGYTYGTAGMSLTGTGASAGAGTSNDYSIISLEESAYFTDDQIYYSNAAAGDVISFASSQSQTGSTDYTYSYIFKLTSDNTSTGNEARAYGQDVWNADDLTNGLTTGSGWFDSDEKTASSTDYFNEYEGTYNLNAASSTTTYQASKLQFDIDGGTYTRYKPVGKFRKWRDAALPAAVTLEGQTLYPGTSGNASENYNASLKIFSEAWYEDGGSSTQIADGGDGSATDDINISGTSGDYTLTGFSNSDSLYLGSDDQFTGANYHLATQGDNGATLTGIDWEYWNGSAWTDLTGDTAIVAGADTFETTNGSFYFTEPTDWAKYTLTTTELGGSTVGERSLYWIRGTPTGGVAAYTTAPIIDRAWTDILVFQYQANITANSQTFTISSAPVNVSQGTIQIDVPNRYRAIMQTGDTTDYLLIYDRAQSDSAPLNTYEFIGPYIYEAAAEYMLRYHNTRKTTILESSSVRVRIRVEGCFDTTGGGACLGSTDFTVTEDYTFTTEGIYVSNTTDFNTGGVALDTPGANENGYNFLMIDGDIQDNAFAGTLYYGDGATEGSSAVDATFEETNTYATFPAVDASGYQSAIIGIPRAGWFDQAGGTEDWRIDIGYSGTIDRLHAREGNVTPTGLHYTKWYFLLQPENDLDAEDERESFNNDYVSPDSLDFTTGNQWSFEDDSDLEGYWKLEEDTTTAADDSSTRNNDLTVSTGDSIPRTTDAREGTYSRDFELSETDYLYITDASQNGLDITGDFTFIAWVKPETVSANMGIANKYQSGGNYSWNVLVQSNGGVGFEASGNGTTSSTAYSPTGQATAGNWLHVGAVYNSSQLRVYTNGSLATSATNPLAYTSGLYNSAAQFQIGTWYNSGSPFDGLIDEVAVFSRALTPTEIEQIYKAGMAEHYNESEGVYTIEASSDQVNLDIDGGANVSTTVTTTAVTAGATSITVGSTTNFPTAPAIAHINGDKFSYTGTTATTFTGIPANGSLSVASHAIGTVVSSMNRHKPMWKIRNYRLNDKPSSVTMEGSSLVEGTDYNLDYKPISNASFAQDLTWYSTMESSTTFTSPDIGDGTGSSASTATFIAGKYGNGINVDANAEKPYFVASNNFSGVASTVEFWYKSTTTDINNARFFSNDNGTTQQIHLQSETANTDIMLRLNISGTMTTIGEWITTNVNVFDGAWHHMLVNWDSSTDAPELWIDGAEETRDTTNIWNSFTVQTNVYVGNSGVYGLPVNGTIDEFRVYNKVVRPTDLIAKGGDTASSNEYLFDEDNDYTFSFAEKDATERGEYLFFGSDAQFAGINVDLATLGVGSNLDLEWEYWNGTAWADLEAISGFTDGTSNLTADGAIYWSVIPTNWRPYSVNGSTDLYYIRASLDYDASLARSYSTSPVENFIKTDILILQYLGNISSVDQTLVVVPENLWLFLSVIPFIPVFAKLWQGKPGSLKRKRRLD